MSDKSLTSQQISFLLFFLLTGSALVHVPEIAAGRDVWIASLIASLSGLYLLLVIFKLNQMYPEQTIIEISRLVLGKTTGTMLNLLFMAGIAVITLVFLYNISILLKVIYQQIPDIILQTLVILSCIYCLYKGLNIMGRLSEVFIWLTLILSIGGLLLSVPLVRLNNLTPVLADWKPIIAGAFFGADRPYVQLIILALFLPFVKNITTKRKTVYWWYLAAVILLVIKDGQIISILGPELTEISRFPLLKVYRLAGFADFRRVELLFLIQWFISAVIAIIIYYQGLLISLQQTFRLKNSRALIFPVGICLIVLAQYMFPSDFVFLNLREYIAFYTLPVSLLYPTIILIVARLRRIR